MIHKKLSSSKPTIVSGCERLDNTVMRAIGLPFITIGGSNPNAKKTPLPRGGRE